MGRFSDTLMDHFLAPRNSGALESPDATGHAGAPGRGPFMILYLRMDSGRVVAAKFQTVEKGDILKYFSRLESMESFILKQLTWERGHS
jgi:hypothetical protein